MSEIATEAVVPVNKLMLRITEGKNPRGIPTAKFIVRVKPGLYILIRI